MTTRIRDKHPNFPGVYLEKQKPRDKFGVFYAKYSDPVTNTRRMVKLQRRTEGYDWKQAANDRAKLMNGEKKPNVDLRFEQREAAGQSIALMAERYFNHFDTRERKYNRDKSIHGNDAKTLELHLIPFFGDKDITGITKKDIQDFAGYLDMAEKRVGEGYYSDQSKRHMMGLLQRILNHNELLFSSMFWKSVMPEVKKRRAKKGYLSTAEMAALRAALANNRHNPVVVRIMLILLTWGCRCSELTRLRWGNVDFKGRTVRLTNRKNGAPDLLLGMDEELYQVFKDQRGGVLPMPDLLVFPGENGQIRDTRSISRATRKILNAAGIDKTFKPTHGFRDNTAFYLHKSKDIETASKYLGHTSTRTTKGYIETIEDGHVEAVSIMSALKEA